MSWKEKRQLLHCSNTRAKKNDSTLLLLLLFYCYRPFGLNTSLTLHRDGIKHFFCIY
jgi:hypothetical protein